MKALVLRIVVQGADARRMPGAAPEQAKAAYLMIARVQITFSARKAAIFSGE